MPTVRQMPELLLRGSLANVTMANLTDAERKQVSEVMTKITTHPDMAKHKSKFMSGLGSTISADYRDDRTTAEQEFNIAVWRGTVSLLFHRKYTFECTACEAKSYRTKQGRQTAMDRQYPVCPNCNKVVIVNPGHTSYKIDQYVDNSEFQESYKNFTPEQEPPICASPIKFIGGERTYENPNTVLNDDRQLVKFFGEFVWNYFRQILKENNRVEHQKTQQKISDRADRVITQEIISLCESYDQDYNYCDKTQPQKGFYKIGINCDQTPPEFSSEILRIIEKARLNGITISFEEDSIKVHVNTAASYITAFVIKPEHVMIMDNYQSETDNEDSGFDLSDIGDRRNKMQDHTVMIEVEDAIETIRDSLPDAECRQVFDICACRGESYARFSNEYGDGRACVNHIARYLNITPRAVSNHKDTIKVNMLAHGMIPR